MTSTNQSTYLNFIDHQSVASHSGQTLEMIDPSLGKAFATIARGNANDVDAAVAAAMHAYKTVWQKTPAFERGRLLTKLSNAVLASMDELALLEQTDCGKPTTQARADVTALARYLEFYAGAADKLTGDVLPYQHGFNVQTWREPHGVTGHIIPWNYPMQIFGRSVGAALATGNACVVKPSEDACLSILRVAELARDVGFPSGVLNIVTGYGHEVGDALAKHAGIHHISFTGSPRVGALIAANAAKRYCPVTLELGGKSPQIVFADADLDAAVPVLVNAIVQNAGQTCSAGSRLLVHESIYEAVLERVGGIFNGLVAAPAAQNLNLGPVIRKTQLERISGYLELAQNDGIATVAKGSIAPNAPADGYYQAPVLLRDVPSNHKLWQEEIFGPVLCAASFKNEGEAIALANGTEYGLCAGIWTHDGERQMRMSRAVQSGQVFINNYGAGGGIELPFGGVKSSGYGREKGYEALYAFTTLKTVTHKFI